MNARAKGHARARYLFPMRPCEECGAEGYDRHHIDDDPLNNDPANVRYLCRRCHMKIDGRLERLRQRMSALAGTELKPPRPCEECGRVIKVIRRGLCGRCYDRAYRPNRNSHKKAVA